ncbi:MAG TPA: lipase maturation factor family protein [Polyangiaceae bacterium]|nr:lipase maturation factor family protein [Polyangiaceae bacterium]
MLGFDNIASVSPLLPFRTSQSFWLVRAALLRGIALIYAVAFSILVRQGPALLGAHGILPAAQYLDRLGDFYHSRATGFWQLPSVFWLASSDAWLGTCAWLGLLTALVALAGFANAPCFALMWALYLSFTHVGQIFYGYGWDSLLCEAGFLAIFLAPAWRPGELRPASPPPLIVVVLYRWLAFRIMFGAGLIKLRGDECWTNLTCLSYHYETQPNPGPLSPWFHAAPLWFHELGALFNHLVEVVAPFGVFGPRPVRLVAGALIVVFQSILIASGNLSFLNWLTLIIGFACFDDRATLRVLPEKLAKKLRVRLSTLEGAQLSKPRRVVSVVLAIGIGILSLSPVVNLLSPHQAMNASFEPFNLVNTYGAFGSVSRERYELIIEGTSAATIDEQTQWREYELPCKPGPLERRPCWITPYHLRLDWQLWFVPLAPDHQRRWFLSLTNKLLRADAAVLGLFAKNPFPDHPPRFIRADFYRYEFAPPGQVVVWKRSRAGQYLPPVSLQDPDFLEALRTYGVSP